MRRVSDKFLPPLGNPTTCVLRTDTRPGRQPSRIPRTVQKACQSFPQRARVSDFTLPDDTYGPTQPPKSGLGTTIPLLVRRDSVPPVLGACARQGSTRAARVAVPKAAVNENHLPPTWKHHVRRTGKIVAMDSVSITAAEQQFPNLQFRRGVALAHALHSKRRKFVDPLITSRRHHARPRSERRFPRGTVETSLQQNRTAGRYL